MPATATTVAEKRVVVVSGSLHVTATACSLTGRLSQTRRLRRFCQCGRMEEIVGQQLLEFCYLLQCGVESFHDVRMSYCLPV